VNPNESGGYPGEAPKNRISGGEPLISQGATVAGENLAYRAFALVYERLGQAVPAVTLTLELEVPLARGLGSSATAIVAGLRAAHYFLGEPLPASQVLAWGVALEGHPDNVVPAWWGGCRLTCGECVAEIPWHPEVTPVLAIPEFALSTAEARAVLPSHVPYRDAVANLGALGCLLQGLQQGSPELLRAGLQDRLHQPYRRGLIPGYDLVERAAQSQGFSPVYRDYLIETPKTGLLVNTKGSPALRVIEPSANLPKRIFGPCRSCKMATWMPRSIAVWRIRRMLRRWRS
jgi:hypothetical protein